MGVVVVPVVVVSVSSAVIVMLAIAAILFARFVLILLDRPPHSNMDITALR